MVTRYNGSAGGAAALEYAIEAQAAAVNKNCDIGCIRFPSRLSQGSVATPATTLRDRDDLTAE
jgi:hypothetical protein